MQFERRWSALRQSVGALQRKRPREEFAPRLPSRALVFAASLLALLALGLLPSPVRTVASAEAQSCTPPAFWNVFAPGGGRCEVYMCADGFTQNNNACMLNGTFAAYAASCPLGWGVRAVDWGIHGHEMRCVDPSPPPPPPTSTIRRDPAPPGSIRPADPPTVTVQATHRLPFTVSESGAAEKSYEFRVASTTEVSVSLTGMNKDIDCRVNASSCTNRGGTADDSWSGTLETGTHTVSVYPYGGGSGSWTLSVSERTPTSVKSSPRPPRPTCPSGYTYVAAASRCERSQSFRMRAIETGISSRQSYSFTLRTSSSVSVSLTGLTRDFDCRVGSSSCTNNWGSADDSWSGTLGVGTHTVLVYPYGSGGPGDYTLTVAVNDVNLVSVVSPTGSGPEEIVCKDGDGNEVNCPTPDQVLVVVGEDPGPPPGTGPGEGNPPPNPNPNPNPNPGPTTPTSSVIGSLKNVVEATKLDCRGMNFEVNERLGTTHGGTNTTRTGHSGIDMNTKGVRSRFYAPVSGTLSYDDQDRSVDDDGNVTWGSGCGHYAKILRSDRTYVIICHLDPAHDVTPGTISAGDLIGKDGQTGHNSGPHLHLAYKRSARDILNPFDLWGGNSSVENEGFSFDDSDPTTCEEPE